MLRSHGRWTVKPAPMPFIQENLGMPTHLLRPVVPAADPASQRLTLPSTWSLYGQHPFQMPVSRSVSYSTDPSCHHKKLDHTLEQAMSCVHPQPLTSELPHFTPFFLIPPQCLPPLLYTFMSGSKVTEMSHPDDLLQQAVLHKDKRRRVGVLALPLRSCVTFDK